jgi:hypothetical protein
MTRFGGDLRFIDRLGGTFLLLAFWAFFFWLLSTTWRRALTISWARRLPMTYHAILRNAISVCSGRLAF